MHGDLGKVGMHACVAERLQHNRSVGCFKRPVSMCWPAIQHLNVVAGCQYELVLVMPEGEEPPLYHSLYLGRYMEATAAMLEML